MQKKSIESKLHDQIKNLKVDHNTLSSSLFKIIEYLSTNTSKIKDQSISSLQQISNSLTNPSQLDESKAKNKNEKLYNIKLNLEKLGTRRREYMQL